MTPALKVEEDWIPEYLPDGEAMVRDIKRLRVRFSMQSRSTGTR